jgi:Arc/MetJ-type ribon-helix-helix transcriptional regulator
VKFRADEQLVAEFDAMVEVSDEHDSRAEALRTAMRRMLGDTEEIDTPLQPPIDQDLRRAYLTLVSASNHNGVIPNDVAVDELCRQLGANKRSVKRTLNKLREMGYIQRLTAFGFNDTGWKLRGVNR